MPTKSIEPFTILTSSLVNLGSLSPTISWIVFGYSPYTMGWMNLLVKSQSHNVSCEFSLIKLVNQRRIDQIREHKTRRHVLAMLIKDSYHPT